MVNRTVVRGLLLAALMAFSVSAQQGGNTMRVLDVRDLVTDSSGAPFTIRPIFGVVGEGEGGSLLPEEAGTTAPVPESNLENVLEEWLGENAEFRIRGGMLTLTGPAADVERCARKVLDLRARAGRRVRVQLVWFDPGEEGYNLQGGRLAADRTGAILEGLAPGGPMRRLAGTTLSVALGGAASWRRITTTPILSGYEGEVASKTRIAHPRTHYAPMGYRARVRVAPLGGGRVALFVEAWRGWRLETRKVTIGLPSTPFVELGAADWVLLAGSGAVARGESLLFCADTEGGRTHLLVRAIEVPGEEKGVVFAGPVFLSWHRDLAVPRPPLPVPYWQERRGWSVTDGEEDPYVLEPAELSHQCKELGLDLKALFPSGVLLAGPAWRADRWRSSPVGAAAAEPRTRTTRLFWKGVPMPDVEGVDSAALFERGRVVRRLALPVLEGRQGLFLCGREYQVLSGYAVEVAEDSSLALPRTESYWSGMAGLVGVGARRCVLRLEDHRLSSPRIVHGGGKDCGPLEQVVHGLAGLSGRAGAGDPVRVVGETQPLTVGEEKLHITVGWQVK